LKRFFLLNAIFSLCGAFPFSLDSSTSAAVLTRNRICELREEAIWQVRRVISNNDGDDAVVHTEKPTVQSLLESRSTGVIDTHVDTIEHNTVQSLGKFTHGTAIGEILTATDQGFGNNREKHFMDRGTDPLQLMVQFCHEHVIEIFWSMRMNDVHNAWGAWYSDSFFPNLKRDHPEYMVTGWITQMATAIRDRIGNESTTIRL
jgi:hypothetical protein